MGTSVPVQTQNASIGKTFYAHANGHATSPKLVGVEIDLFSYNVPKEKFEQVLNKICGGSFRYRSLKEDQNQVGSFFITPQEHCLVDGGMMYTSAVSLLKEITNSGLLVAEYRTVVGE